MPVCKAVCLYCLDLFMFWEHLIGTITLGSQKNRRLKADVVWCILSACNQPITRSLCYEPAAGYIMPLQIFNKSATRTKNIIWIIGIWEWAKEFSHPFNCASREADNRKQSPLFCNLKCTCEASLVYRSLLLCWIEATGRIPW